jgi:lactose/L-arabinose transport system ATP-binding protein
VLPDLGGQVLPMPPLSALPYEGAELTAGLRPDAFRKGGAAALRLMVEIVEHLGAETLVHARAGAGGPMVTLVTDEGRSVQSGQEIAARFDPGALYLFDAGGRRVR